MNLAALGPIFYSGTIKLKLPNCIVELCFPDHFFSSFAVIVDAKDDDAWQRARELLAVP
jgi:hypothetical protein